MMVSNKYMRFFTGDLLDNMALWEQKQGFVAAVWHADCKCVFSTQWCPLVLLMLINIQNVSLFLLMVWKPIQMGFYTKLDVLNIVCAA